MFRFAPSFPPRVIGQLLRMPRHHSPLIGTGAAARIERPPRQFRPQSARRIVSAHKWFVEGAFKLPTSANRSASSTQYRRVGPRPTTEHCRRSLRLEVCSRSLYERQASGSVPKLCGDHRRRGSCSACIVRCTSSRSAVEGSTTYAATPTFRPTHNARRAFAGFPSGTHVRYIGCCSLDRCIPRRGSLRASAPTPFYPTAIAASGERSEL